MKTYREWSPTGYDYKGLNADTLGLGAWFVSPVIRTRDSGPLDRANFDAAVNYLEGCKALFETHRFGHWANGWFEIILIHPTNEACGDVLETMLADYPIIDEQLYSQYEYEEACLAWTHMSLRDRVPLAERFGFHLMACRRSELPRDESGELISYLVEP